DNTQVCLVSSCTHLTARADGRHSPAVGALTVCSAPPWAPPHHAPPHLLPTGVLHAAPLRSFFQAEDGIRDWSVTRVQTCALPICSVPDHQPEHSSGLSAECHSHANFVCALGYRISKHPGEPDRRQQQSQRGEEAQQPCVQPLLAQALLGASRLCAYFRHWQVAVKLVNYLSNRWSKRCGVAGSPQSKVHFSYRFKLLSPGCVQKRLNLFSLAAVFRVANNADDFNLSFAVSISYVFAEHIFIRKELLPEGLVYYS